MKKAMYEVVVTIWSEEEQKQVQVVAGTFDKWFNASLFAEAYRKHFSAKANIIEYRATEPMKVAMYV